ncbi:MAG: rod shape-determining protein MreC [Bacillota bacterium]
MIRFFEENRKKIFGVVIGISIVLGLFFGRGAMNATAIESGIGFVVTPFQELITGVETWLISTVDSYRSREVIVAENEALKLEIEKLQLDNQRLSKYEEESSLLSEILGITEKYPEYSQIGARVIAKNPDIWYYTFTLDCGTEDDVHGDMVLIGAGGLVGKITESGTTHSVGQAIIDSRSSVSAMSARTKDLGIVKGDYALMEKGLCKMEYIDPDSQIVVGDEIVTSHLSEIYPEGVPIGTIAEIELDTNGLTKYAIIKPYVDFKHLNTVSIIDIKEEN